jgi:hypothetical protein
VRDTSLAQPVVSWNDAEEWLRLPSVLAVVVAAIATYRLGRRLAGRHAGAAASLVLAASAGVVGLSQSVGPLGLALAAMMLSSALFARAVERGNAVWWAVYAVSAALLPLTHPVAASALVAHLAAIAVARREIDLRLALPAAAVAVVESGLFLTAAVIDRAAAEDGAGPLELADLAVGLSGLGQRRVAGLAAWASSSTAARPPSVLVGARLRSPRPRRRRGAAAPSRPHRALAGSRWPASASSPTRRWIPAGGALAAVAVAALVDVVAGSRPRARALVRRQSTPHSTVGCFRARASALAYYAPELRVARVGRGDAVSVVVVGDPDEATQTARTVVSPPRYALLAQDGSGSRLVVQHWVRPGA